MYCNKGHKLTEVSNTVFVSDCYVCLQCKQIYELQYVQINSFSDEIVNSVIKFAKIVEAKKLVTKDDLKELGYLND